MLKSSDSKKVICYDKIKHITIEDLLYLATKLKLQLKDSLPQILKFMTRHNISSDEVEQCISIITKLELYP